MHLVFKNKIEATYAGRLELIAMDGSTVRDHPFREVERQVMQGEAVGRFPETAFAASKKPPDLLAFGSHYVASDHVKRVMESMSAEAIFYPVKIHEAGTTIHDYSMISFTKQAVDCIDLERSEGAWVEDKLKGERVNRLKDPTKLVLKPDVLEGIHVCKVDRTHFRHVLEIISLELACALQAEELTGMWFFTAEEYRYPDYVKIASGGMAKQPLDCSSVG